MAKGRTEAYSYSRKLKNEGRSNELFESQVAELSLEELIGLKLEISSRDLNGKLYGFPVWNSMPDIIKDAVIKYAISATKTHGDAARMLGISPENFYKLTKRYKVDEYFLKKSQKNT